MLVSEINRAIRVLLCESFVNKYTCLYASRLSSVGEPLIRIIFRSLANFKIPATLFGWSFPISSIMQCNLKSLNFREAASLNTLISMILIIAFTRISVPSEPTLEIFSTNPVSLPFSTMRKRSSKESYSRILS